MRTNAIDGSRYLASCWVRRGCRTIVRRSSGISGGILLAFRVGIPTDSALVIYFTFRENEKGGVLCKLEPRWKSVLQSEQPASCGRSTLQIDKDLAGPSEDRSTGRAVSWEIYRMPVYRSLDCRAPSLTKSSVGKILEMELVQSPESSPRIDLGFIGFRGNFSRFLRRTCRLYI